ncbi:MAG: hypothetical protein HYZ17_12270 [Betaproteobacteria bacterium]|nr:MAG: hypothetical protein F9K47_18055 [Burkholderiales bacterium]MBI3149275.1 hypothetical protein [Betaproteobacteria bacterium]
MDFVSAANWFIKRTGSLSVTLAAAVAIGVPAILAIATTNSYAPKAGVGALSNMILWLGFYGAIGAVILLFAVGEHLRVFKYQRPNGEPTVEALCSIFNNAASTNGTKTMVILFCTSYHCFVGSMAGSVGAVLAQRFVLGTSP